MRTIVLLVLALFTASCSQPPAMITRARKAELLRGMERELTDSVNAEKHAVLSTTDETSERFAAESRQASAQLDLLRKELRTLVNTEEGEKLDAFDQAWAQLLAVDAKLLPLATANSNLKAARLSAHDAAAKLEVVLAALHSAEAATKDPARLRVLSAAAVAALRIQALHATHIASAEVEEMDALEARVKELQAQVGAVLAKPGEPLEAAQQAWVDYQRLTDTIFALSRANTNVLSYALSVNEKRAASGACEVALRALIDQVHDVPRATR